MPHREYDAQRRSYWPQISRYCAPRHRVPLLDTRGFLHCHRKKYVKGRPLLINGSNLHENNLVLFQQNDAHLWYPLSALPELLAVLLFATPGLVPSRREIAEAKIPQHLGIDSDAEMQHLGP